MPGARWPGSEAWFRWLANSDADQGNAADGGFRLPKHNKKEGE